MVIILRGVSGSGKSSLVRRYVHGSDMSYVGKDNQADEYLQRLTNLNDKRIVSADDYFIIDGEYKFDASKLAEAHNTCLRSFSNAVRDLRNWDIIVDNTNCSIAEVSAYAMLAKAYAHDLHILTLIGDPTICWKRGRHGTPFGTVFRQDLTLRQSVVDWPSWFPQQVFQSG